MQAGEKLMILEGSASAESRYESPSHPVLAAWDF